MESEKIGILLKTLSKSIEKSMKRVFQELDVNMTQMEMLGFLFARQGTETCQTDVQNELLLTNPAVTKLVAQLSGKGLIRVMPSSRDLRVKNLEITPEGIDLLKECGKKKAPLELNTLAGFTEKEIRNLNAYLTRIINNVT